MVAAGSMGQLRKETAEGAPEEDAPEPTRGVTIHVPGDDLGRDGTAEPAVETPAEPEVDAAEEPTTAEAEGAPKPKRKTRRGSRGGKNRKKKPATASQNGAEAAADAEAAPEVEAPVDGDFDYVPMSEWADDLESR